MECKGTKKREKSQQKEAALLRGLLLYIYNSVGLVTLVLLTLRIHENLILRNRHEHL